MAKGKNKGEIPPRGSRREPRRPDGVMAGIAPAMLDWEHKTGEIGPAGLDIERTASPVERGEIAKALDLVAVDRLKVSYRLRPRSGDLYGLEGRLEADLRQTCVVSLEEMTTHIDEPLSAEFWPAERLSHSAPVLIDDVEGEEPLPIRDDVIVTGRLVYDVLALAIDPHPRKQEAAFEWKDKEDGPQGSPEASATPSPFAQLAKLRKDGG